MSQKSLVLFDLPRRGPCACWSPNVWKTRLVLNYKKIPYTTVWLPHHEIGPRLQALGLPPNQPTGKPGPPPSPYTVPAIQLPDDSLYMDSAAIAAALEQRYPTPSLHLARGLHEQAQALVNQLAVPLLPVFMPRVGRDVLRAESEPAWRAKREAAFGMPVEEWERTKGGEPAWVAAKPVLEKLDAFVATQKEDEGPFLLGSTLSYGDFVIAGMLEAFRRIGQDMFDRIVEEAPQLKAMHEACQGLFEKDT